MTRLAALLLAALACSVHAHDSWLVAAGGDGAFAFSTGMRYPVAESAPAAVQDAGCVDGSGRRRPLRPAGGTATASQLQAAASGPLACWATLGTHEITLAPALVEVYLHEIRPPAEVRSAWAGLQERGLPWVESYRKFARIERDTGAAPAEELRRLRAPLGMPLEIVVLGDAPLRVGELADFQVLSQGEPVAGLAVELVSERSKLGVWARSDVQGRWQHRLPFGGAWLLRATLLEPDGERWRSRFVTLTFDVAAR